LLILLFAESRCVALASPPISIVPYLTGLLEPTTDIKLKHGVVGLLKNLAQAPPTRIILGEEGVVEAIVRSKIWDRLGDIADVVQLSAVGIVKHLATGNSELCYPISPTRINSDSLDGVESAMH
jgi:Rap1 GTPase-GDP dissociation stimulator 1